MFKYYFEQINEVAIWPVISLIIFFTFFVGLLIWVWRVDKNFVSKMKNLPLEDERPSVKTTVINPNASRL